MLGEPVINKEVMLGEPVSKEEVIIGELVAKEGVMLGELATKKGILGDPVVKEGVMFGKGVEELVGKTSVAGRGAVVGRMEVVEGEIRTEVSPVTELLIRKITRTNILLNVSKSNPLNTRSPTSGNSGDVSDALQ